MSTPGFGNNRIESNRFGWNPFEVPETRINQFTAQEIATLQRRLDMRLGPEYLSTRPGAGGQRIHYLTGSTVINLANEIFGFNGWSSSIQNITVDDVKENPSNGKCSVALSVIMRVTLRDGTFHEDIGYGHGENFKERASAFEKAKKEGTTDALKRALRTFGNVLGNCIYEKEYLNQVSRIKVAPTKYDINSLHRQPEYQEKIPQSGKPGRTATNPPHQNINESQASSNSLQPQSSSKAPVPAPAPAPVPEPQMNDVDLEAEFGSDLFDEADFDEPHALDPEIPSVQGSDPTPNAETRPPNFTYGQQSSVSNAAKSSDEFITPTKPSRAIESVHPARTNLTSANGNNSTTSNSEIHSNNVYPKPITAPVSKQQTKPENTPLPISNSSSDLPPPLPQAHLAAPRCLLTTEIPEEKRPKDPVGGFYSAKAADTLHADPYGAPKTAPVFDVRFESPSIRKTTGFNHNTSAPVARNTLTIVPPQTSQTNSRDAPISRRNTPGPRGGFMNLVGQPGMSTTLYKPPTRKASTRSGCVNASESAYHALPNQNGKRPPLGDLTNAPTSPSDPDFKRSRVLANNNWSTDMNDQPSIPP